MSQPRQAGLPGVSATVDCRLPVAQCSEIAVVVVDTENICCYLETNVWAFDDACSSIEPTSTEIPRSPDISAAII